MCDFVSGEEVEAFIFKYLTKQKWAELGDSLKTRYWNTTRNYLSVGQDENMPLPDYVYKSADIPNFQSKATNKKRNTSAKSTEKAQSKAPLRKNPKRNVAQVNYFEEKEPGEDRYVFCDNCEEECLDFCTKCGMLKSLRDLPVPFGTEDRAKKTIPKSVLEVRPSKIHGFGVFAIRDIRKGIQMGPYEGHITRVDTTNGYCWKLRDGRLIDGADETRSNWLRYVNCAKNVKEQNVIAFQYKKQIFYRTCKDVQKGEELLVYYGQSFAEILGINTKQYFHPDSEEIDSEFYCCEFCGVGLSTIEYRNMHEKRCRFRPNRVVLCSRDDNFVCQYCKCTLTKEEFLRTHEINCGRNPKRGGNSAGKEKNFRCSRCGKKFSEKYHLVRHEVIHDTENAKLFECYKCPFKTNCSSNLRAHERIHTAGTRFKCPSCQHGFNRKHELDSHILKKHQNLHHLITSKMHGCNKCTYITIQSTHLKRHMKTHEGNISHRFKCDRCHFTTIQKNDLKRHLLTHFPSNKPYACVKCGKIFIRKDELDAHIFNNHKENENLMKSVTSKIHSCTMCNYKTIFVTQLKHHVYYKHDKSEKNNLKIHTCRACDKNFITKQQLDGHILSHHAQNSELVNSITSKMYNCNFCKFKSVQKTHFTRHVATHTT